MTDFPAVIQPALNPKQPAPITGEELEEMKGTRQRALQDLKDFYPQYSPAMVQAVHDLSDCIAEIERLRAALQAIGDEPEDLCRAHSEGFLCGGAKMARELLSA
jgi:hypothetical protein